MLCTLTFFCSEHLANVLSVLICNHPTCLRQHGVFFRSLHFMSLQCFVTTTRAALTAHYSINPRLGLSLTHLPPSEDRRFRQIRARFGYGKERGGGMLSCSSVFSSNGTWNLGAKCCLAVCSTRAFSILEWAVLVCIRSQTQSWVVLARKSMSRSKEYKPSSLWLLEIG